MNDEKKLESNDGTKGVVVTILPDSALPVTEEGLVADLQHPGIIETRGTGGEPDPNWWRERGRSGSLDLPNPGTVTVTENADSFAFRKFDASAVGATKLSPLLEKLLKDEVPITLGPRARFFAQIQNAHGVEAAAAMLSGTRSLKGMDADYDGNVARPKKRKKESPAVKKYRNVMNVLIARAAPKPTVPEVQSGNYVDELPFLPKK